MMIVERSMKVRSNSLELMVRVVESDVTTIVVTVAVAGPPCEPGVAAVGPDSDVAVGIAVAS
jgi:hypothetical protein